MIRWLAAVLVLGLSSSPAWAEEPQSECDAILGDVGDHGDNAASREARISTVLQSDAHVTVVLFEHTTGKPSPISLRGVELLSADIDSGVARITIEPSSGLPCADGVYEVLVDDSLGTEMSVVAVLDDALLLDRDGSLHYLPTDAEARIEWSMVWRSRFGVAPKTTAPRGTKRVTPKRPRTHKRR